MKTKSEPAAPVADLRTLRAAVDAPARQRAEVEAREREAEQRTRQDALLVYARQIAEALAPAVTALAAWTVTPVAWPEFLRIFGEGTAVTRLGDAVNGGSAPIADTARVAGEVAALVRELEQPPVLPAPRLAAILGALDHAAGHAEGWPSLYASWIRVREDGRVQLEAALKLTDALRRHWTPSAEERTLLAQQQERLAAASTAMPSITPKAPARAVSGAVLDGMPSLVQSERPSRAPAGIRNLEGA
jgi:hypothetical protein